MAKPAFVFCDTDALLQFLLVREVRPLRILKAKYAVQPIVVPEVEIELRSHRRYASQIEPELRKALDSGLVLVLNGVVLEKHFGSPPAASLAAGAALEQIGKLGKQLQARVDTGEAYTFAAAMILGMPALSHDRSALNTLLAAKIPVPSTVLRAFDLMSLCFQSGNMDISDCEAFRKALLDAGEYVPECFANYSFFNGLADFSPRICDGKAKPLGKPPEKPMPYSKEIEL